MILFVMVDGVGIGSRDAGKTRSRAIAPSSPTSTTAEGPPSHVEAASVRWTPPSVFLAAPKAQPATRPS